MWPARAKQLSESMTQEWKPEQYNDEYHEALEKLIDEKIEDQSGADPDQEASGNERHRLGVRSTGEPPAIERQGREQEEDSTCPQTSQAEEGCVVALKGCLGGRNPKAAKLSDQCPGIFDGVAIPVVIEIRPDTKRPARANLRGPPG